MNLWQMFLLGIFDTASIFIIMSKLDSRIGKNKGKVIILISFMIALSTSYNYYELPMRVPILACFVVILLSILFDISLLNAMFDYFVAFTTIVIIQIIAMLILQLFRMNVFSFLNGMMISIIVLLISIFVNKLIPIHKLESIYIKRKKIINALLLVILIPLMLYSIVWDANHVEGWNYIPLIFSGIIIWTLVVVIVFFEIIKITEKRKSIKIYEEYNPLLENLMEELRAKQHDIKNHLQTIYGLAENHSDSEITDYIESLDQSFAQKDKYILTGNIIISALMYSKRNKAQGKDISFEFHFENPIPDYPLKEYEITEVMGNIIDNAIDAVEQTKAIEKKVIVNLRHEDHYKIIEVLNTGQILNSQDTIFQIGFSTKGSKRGYGLYNVEKIVKSHKGFIEVSHLDGVTSFKLMFP